MPPDTHIPATPASFTIRPLTIHDLDVICHHRHAMFSEMGLDPAALQASITAFRPWLADSIATGNYFGLLAEDARGIAGGIGLLRLPWPPHPHHPSAPDRGYILNVYVEPHARRHGLATRLMRLAEEEFQRRKIHYLVLHASAQGRPVYEQLGWHSSSEMVKHL